jgi:predicted O-methyltransferase YrrM
VELLERVIAEKPSFHAGETEVSRAFEPSESFLDKTAAERLATSGLTCYGIGEDVLRFLGESVDERSRTLETGAGCSTLVFALRRARHIAITPSSDEIGRIRSYASGKGIGMDTVEFVAASSDAYLPRCEVEDLDVVLLDGKHAFPWPIVDWFFTADKLRRGGVMILDDAQMRSVSVLADFMRAGPGWELVRDFSGKTLAFRKTRDRVLDVAWHMQAWTVAQTPAESPGVLARIASRLGQRSPTR